VLPVEPQPKAKAERPGARVVVRVEVDVAAPEAVGQAGAALQAVAVVGAVDPVVVLPAADLREAFLLAVAHLAEEEVLADEDAC